MSFSEMDYTDFCENLNTVNKIYDEVIETKKDLFQYVSKEIKAIFKEYMGCPPVNTHFAKDGSRIEVIYNLSDFKDKQLPLARDLIDEVHMPVQIRILDNDRLVFVLLPNVEV